MIQDCKKSGMIPVDVRKSLTLSQDSNEKYIDSGMMEFLSSKFNTNTQKATKRPAPKPKSKPRAASRAKKAKKDL